MPSPNLPSAVTSAIASGDINQLKKLYQPNTSLSLHEIAKHAARQGQPEILQWCCDQGWKPPRESYNNDFIPCAVDGANLAIWQILLDNGLDLNAQESEACGDILAGAIMGNSYNLAKWLLEHGHRPTPIDPYHGPSAISWVICHTGDLEMLTLLLDYGHDLEESGAGVAAADEGNVEALRLLLERGVNIEDSDMSGYPFSPAENENDDRDEPYESQGTALYRACRQGNVECVELLLEWGADPLATDLEGTSCLEIAKRRGHEEVVWVLERRGVVG
jgi:ankyrin repeat protein